MLALLKDLWTALLFKLFVTDKRIDKMNKSFDEMMENNDDEPLTDEEMDAILKSL